MDKKETKIDKEFLTKAIADSSRINDENKKILSLMQKLKSNKKRMLEIAKENSELREIPGGLVPVYHFNEEYCKLNWENNSLEGEMNYIKTIVQTISQLELSTKDEDSRIKSMENELVALEEKKDE